MLPIEGSRSMIYKSMMWLGAARGLEQETDVATIAGDDVCVQVGGGLRDDGVDDIAGRCAADERAGGMSSLFGQGHDLASAQEPTELYLAG